MKIKWNVTSDHDMIVAMTESISKSVKRLQDQLHIAVCSVILHAVEHGNSTPTNNLFNAVGAGKGAALRTNAMKLFVLEAGPFTYNDETKAFELDKERAKAERAKFEAAPAEYVKALAATPWNEAKPQAEFKGFDLKAEVKKLVKKAETTAKKHANDERCKVDEAVLNQLKAVA